MYSIDLDKALERVQYDNMLQNLQTTEERYPNNGQLILASVIKCSSEKPDRYQMK